MKTAPDLTPQRGIHIPLGVGLCLFLGIAIFFLWEEHRAHILGIAPYVLLLMCPLIHLFMHRGHGGHGEGHTGHGGQAHRHEDGGAS
jgi:hypothetical protein